MLSLIIKKILSLRYSIKTTGLDKIRLAGDKKIIFLPNHPALIDPIIIMASLFDQFKPRPLADSKQLDVFMANFFLNIIRPISIPDIKEAGIDGKKEINKSLGKVIECLEQNENVLIYPSGHVYRSPKEKIGANSAVEQIVKMVPEARIVLVRITGLWGSSFSWAASSHPTFWKKWKTYLASILTNGIAFIPKRQVNIEFYEPENFPRDTDKLEINKYLENFYNKKIEVNTYFPYFPWEERIPIQRPEPEFKNIADDYSKIPAETQKLVLEKLSEISGVNKITPADKLSSDLGIDSLTLTDFIYWIQDEFGAVQEDIEAIQTVADCFLIASGEIISQKNIELNKIPAGWFKNTGKTRLEVHSGKNIPAIFIKQARENPEKIIIADQVSGAKTYRDIILGIMVLKKEFKKITDKYIGIMLPASVGSTICYLAVLFAEKIPVMVNWTAGESSIKHSLKQTNVNSIITSQRLLDKIKDQGFKPEIFEQDWVVLEKVREKIKLKDKLFALVKSKCYWSDLYDANIPETAVILFTSGSETQPKSVPLSHKNIIANLKDISEIISFYDSDKLLGVLPPFHSFGLTGTVVMPLCYGLKTVYYPNPNDSAILASLVKGYKASMFISTPTFLNGILRVSSTKEIESLRLVVTGAERCPDYIFDTLAELNSKTILCEGYGITECSPVISANDVNNIKRGTVGKVVPSMEYAIVDQEITGHVKKGERGILLVRGNNVFDGYLGSDAKSPFVEFEMKNWYNTGDFVIENADGILTFKGRLKRFIKLGGEMISLPAIENALSKYYQAGQSAEGPSIAIEATPSETHPEIVLFTVKNLDREEVNNLIKREGLSSLHNIRKIIKLDEIPLLGTGKIDYRKLKTILVN